MALIFISHSSRNNDRAVELRDWLESHGYSRVDIFLDLDPGQGIAAGEKWKEALRKAAHRCEAVLALVSPDWIASDWCRGELTHAELAGKKIFVLLIGSKGADLASSFKDAQYVDLITDPDAYTRLKIGLERAGLNAASFSFEDGRCPYPGLAPLQEGDAAVFFGRDAQVVDGLDTLRRVTRTGVKRMLVILGASGCGKSSFLRAGLWPRLKRDESAWLPLKMIRPERAVISGKFGLVEALYGLMNEEHFAKGLDKDLPRSRAGIEEFLLKHNDSLLEILAALRKASQVPGLSDEQPSTPTIVIPIDQGEELFSEEGHAEANRFIDVLVKTLDADDRTLALLTMRTDSFPQVQNHPILAALPKETFALDRMLEGSYRAVIEGPAAKVKPKPLKIDPKLTEALLEDAAGQDALALLAFTLRHLYDRYQANNELKLESYEKIGRLKGVIETTVKQALDEGVAKGELPKDEKAQLALIRKAFVPHLSRVNSEDQFVRRVSTRSEIPSEAWPLIDRFAEARLLIKDRRLVRGEDVEIIEVAHEALLREWHSLNTALKEEREFLVGKTLLERDLAEWEATPDKYKEGALLSGNKLGRARDWVVEHPQELTADELRFIKASEDAEEAQKRRAKEQRDQMLTTQSQFLAELANQQTLDGDSVTGMLLALEGLPDRRSIEELERDRPYVAGAEIALLRAFYSSHELHLLAGHDAFLEDVSFSVDGAFVATASYDKTARVWDAHTGKLLALMRGHLDGVRSAQFSLDNLRLVTASRDKTARIWDIETLTEVAILEGHESDVVKATFGGDGDLVLTTSEDGTVRLWDARSGKQIRDLLRSERFTVPLATFNRDGTQVLAASSQLKRAVIFETRTGDEVASFAWPDAEVECLALSFDGLRIVTRDAAGTARVWDVRTSAEITALKGHDSYVKHAVISPVGSLALTITSEGRVRLWDIDTGGQRDLFGNQDVQFSEAVTFSSDGTHIAIPSKSNTISLWNVDTGTKVKDLHGHEEMVRCLRFSPQGTTLVTGSSDATARIWGTRHTLGFICLESAGDKLITAAFNPDGAQLLTLWRDSSLRSYDAGTGELATSSSLSECAFSEATFSGDGARLAVVLDDGTGRLWNAVTWQCVAELKTGQLIKHITFSPTGNYILTRSSGERETLCVWDANTGRQISEQISSLKEFSLAVAAISSGGDYVAYGGQDSDVFLWRISSGTVSSLKGHHGWIESLAFSPNDEYLLSGSDDGKARVWRVDSATCVGIIKHSQPAKELGVHHLAFSRDGKLAATAGDAGEAFVWDIVSGREITVLDHRGLLDDTGLGRLWDGKVEFSPDGRRVLSTLGSTARIWDAATGTEIAALDCGVEPLVRAAYSPSGDQMVTVSRDQTIRIWKTFGETQALIDYTKKVVPRALAIPQRKKFFLNPKPPYWSDRPDRWPFHTISRRADVNGARYLFTGGVNDLIDRLRSHLDESCLAFWAVECMEEYIAGVRHGFGLPSAHGFDACGNAFDRVVQFLVENSCREAARSFMEKYRGSVFFNQAYSSIMTGD